jgi:hypothetical protein
MAACRKIDQHGCCISLRNLLQEYAAGADNGRSAIPERVRVVMEACAGVLDSKSGHLHIRQLLGRSSQIASVVTGPQPSGTVAGGHLNQPADGRVCRHCCFSDPLDMLKMIDNDMDCRPRCKQRQLFDLVCSDDWIGQNPVNTGQFRS